MMRWVAWFAIATLVGAFCWTHVTSGLEIVEVRRLKLQFHELCATLESLRAREDECRGSSIAHARQDACRALFEEVRQLRRQQAAILGRRDEIEGALGWKARFAFRRNGWTCAEYEVERRIPLAP